MPRATRAPSDATHLKEDRAPRGRRPSQATLDARATEKLQRDVLDRWLKARTIKDMSSRGTQPKTLYDDYTIWIEENVSDPLELERAYIDSIQKFGLHLYDWFGFQSRKVGGIKYKDRLVLKNA